MPPRTKVQSWKYIAANPNDDEANTANDKQSWPTLMQLNKALDILDKKEQAMGDFYYPQASFRQTDEGFSCVS